MADNVPITAGVGTSIATDDVGGVQFQRVKLAQGADGVAVDVTAAAPLNVALPFVTESVPMPVRLPGVSELAPLPVITRNSEGRQPSFDAFGRMRTGNAFTLADLIMRYEIDSRDWLQAVSGGGAIAYLPNQQAAQITVNASSGASAVLQTHEYYRYQAGKAQWIRMTGFHTDIGQTNQVREWGYFDAEDGLFFKLNGYNLSLVRRTFTSGVAVDNEVAQSFWNVDPLDGSGPSGEILDLQATQIYEIEFQHLAVGEVRWRINGRLVHVSTHANLLYAPYMRTAQLPVRVRVANTGAAASGGYTHVCASVESHGGTAPPRETFSAPGAPADINVGSGLEVPLLSMRLKATYGGKTNRMLVVPEELNVNISQAGRVRMVLNPTTLTGASWTSADSRSGVEFDTSATAFTGGQSLWARTLIAAASENRTLDGVFGYPNRYLRMNGDGTVADTLVLVASRTSVGAMTGRAALSWGEIR